MLIEVIKGYLLRKLMVKVFKRGLFNCLPVQTTFFYIYFLLTYHFIKFI